MKTHVTPAGSPEHAKLIAELNPYCGVTVSVTAPCPPELIVRDLGDAPRVNAAGGADVTLSVTVVVSTVLPLVPVTVIGYSPTAVPKFVEIVICEEPVLVIEAGLKLTLTPFGSPLAPRATAELKPPAAVTLIVTVPLFPAATLRDALAEPATG